MVGIDETEIVIINSYVLYVATELLIFIPCYKTNYTYHRPRLTDIISDLL